MQEELLQQIRRLNTVQLLQLIAEAKTVRKDVYRTYIPQLTKRETAAQLDWFIELAEEGAGFRS